MGFFNTLTTPFQHLIHKGRHTTQGPENMPKLQPTPSVIYIAAPINMTWLHSHPNAPHFDKSDVLPHERLIGGNPSTWSPTK